MVVLSIGTKTARIKREKKSFPGRVEFRAKVGPKKSIPVRAIIIKHEILSGSFLANWKITCDFLGRRQIPLFETY